MQNKPKKPSRGRRRIVQGKEPSWPASFQVSESAAQGTPSNRYKIDVPSSIVGEWKHEKVKKKQ
jgi:hypothetical protein